MQESVFNSGKPDGIRASFKGISLLKTYGNNCIFNHFAVFTKAGMEFDSDSGEPVEKSVVISVVTGDR